MKRNLLFVAVMAIVSIVSAQNATAFNATENGSKKYGYVSISSGSNLRISGGWTLESWVKRNQVNLQDYIIESYTSPGNSTSGGFVLRLDGGKIQAYQFAGANGHSVITGTTVIPLNEWHHIAATLDTVNQTLNIYLDGVLEASTASVAPLQNNNNTLKIGARGDNAYMSPFGNYSIEIDNARIWGFPKTVAQIVTDTLACLSGSETGLLAWYDFENPTSTTLVDKSIHNNDGIYVNFNSANFTNRSYTCLPTNCTVNIPDVNFKNYLLSNTAININGDTEIQCSEASSFTGFISAQNQGISDLTGIEMFTSAVRIHCDNNSLTSINFSNNAALEQISCDNNLLTSIDISQNTALTYLSCRSNLLASLDISQNLVLTELFCSSNVLTSLNVSQNTLLTKLWCNANAIPALNVSSNVVLNELVCSNNSLSNLDVAQNTGLSLLSCKSNQITALNISNNTTLTNLSCFDNLISSLDISQNNSLTQLRCNDNNLISLNVANGYNTIITQFHVNNNPNLTCIQVDDINYSMTNWINIDAIASFNTNCSSSACIVHIPDANFKNYLINHPVININGDTEIQCSEASAFTGVIGAASLSISDLTGIEEFTALTELDCRSNSLTILNVTQNTALTKLLCSTNSLNNLDVTQNINLEILYCDNNNISSLDVSSNTLLNVLNCSLNSLNALDISSNTVLGDLFCSSNNLTVLNTANNSNLRQLGCANNQLTTLPLSTNTNIIYLRCNNNQISGLNLSANSLLSTIFCADNQLINLDVSNGNNSNISNGSINITNNPSLTCIQVDDVNYSTNNWTNIDAIASFNTNCNNTTSIEGLDEQYSINIYPNPIENILFLKSFDLIIEEIEIITALGETVSKKYGNISKVDITNVPRGAYIVRIKTEKGILNRKIIKK